MGGEARGVAGEVPGGEEEQQENRGGPEEELQGKGAGEWLVGVGVGADGETEEQGAEQGDGRGEGEFGEDFEEAVLPVEAGEEEGGERCPVKGEEAGEEGGGFGELEHRRPVGPVRLVSGVGVLWVLVVGFLLLASLKARAVRG